MFELLKAAAWKYIKIVIADTVYDIRKEVARRELEDHDDNKDKPKMEGGLSVSTDFEHPYLLGRENEVTAKFGFTSADNTHTRRIRD